MKLNEQLLQYLSENCWKKSIMINGEWGVGKTTTINNFLLNYNKIKFKNKNAIDVLKYTHYCKINGYEIDQDFDVKKFIVKNSRSLKSNALDPLFDNLVNKGLNNMSKLPLPIRKLAKNIMDNTELSIGIAKLNCNNIINDFYNDHMHYVYEKTDISKCIIIIDEIDRKYNLQKNNLKIIFSKMIDLMENNNSKIIFIVNKNELKKNDKDLIQSWTEKMFDLTLNINTPIGLIPDYFSETFKEHISKNTRFFNNYRSINKYNKFCKEIDEKFSYVYDSNLMKSIIIEYKETLFYEISIIDNNIDFEEEENKNYMLIRSHTDLINRFLQFEYKPLFDQIENDLNYKRGELGKIISDSDKFLKSHYICHRKDHKNALRNPLEFLISKIDAYKDSLNIEFINNPEHEFSTWICRAIELNIKKEDLNKLFDMLISRLKKYYKKNNNFNKNELMNMKKNLDHMLVKYKEMFVNHNDFILKIEEIINENIENIEKDIFNNISINDSDDLLKYYLNHYNNVLEDIINKSDNFIIDLRKLRSLNEGRYFELRDEFLKKYPTNNDRYITNKMFNIADKPYIIQKT